MKPGYGYRKVALKVHIDDRAEVVAFAKNLRTKRRRSEKDALPKMRWTVYRSRVKKALDAATREHPFGTPVSIQHVAEKYDSLYPDHALSIRTLAQTLVRMSDYGVVGKIWENGTWEYYAKTI